MNKTKTSSLLIFGILILVFFTCNKDENPIDTPIDNPPSLTSSYFPMTIGNYWVYDVYFYNTETETIDSIFPQKDTARIIEKKIIDGETFYVFEEDSWLTTGFTKINYYRRDSAGYIIDNRHYKLFSATDFNTTLFNSVLTNGDYINFYVSDSIVNFSTPAGSFECLDVRGDIWINDTLSHRTLHTYYSDGIGLVMENKFHIYATWPHEVRRVLKEYHLE